tara:strand:+ start:436 stop:606 length:171 start_codon:yes stop_codon:yes gene_type:complete
MKTAKLTALELATILEANRDQLIVWVRRHETNELIEVTGVAINGASVQLEVEVDTM